MSVSRFFIYIMLMIGLTCTTSACQKNTTTTVPDNGEPVPTNPNQQKILDLVNEARTNGHTCGSDYYPPTSAVSWNSKLEAAAQNHSDDMNSTGNLDHTGADGSRAGDRITKAGYTWAAYGENIAEGYSSEEAVVEAWLNSEGHCKNIMSPDFTEMGVATSGEYWTQVFASPR